MSSENRDNEGDLIDLHVRSPVLPRASPTIHIYTEVSDNLIDTELPALEQKLQTASQTVNPITDSRRTSVDVEDILITIDDDEIDAPQKISEHFLDLCDNNLVENLEALSVLKNLDDVLNASLLDDADSTATGEEANSTQAQQDIEDCLKDLDNYLRALDSSSSEDYSDSSNESHEDQWSTRSSGNHSLVDALEPSTDEESLRNKLRQMEENYTKFLASGCINRGYVDTERNESDRRPLSACDMVSDALNKNQPGRATVAVVRRERPSLRKAIEDGKSRCGSERISGTAGDSDEDIDWSWLQDVARDVTLERRAHAAGDCCTGTVVVEPPRPVKPCSSSEPTMNEEPKEDARSSTWLRTSMRRLRHLRLPSNETSPETESNITTNTTEPSRLEQPQVTATVRPVSAPSRLPPSGVRTSTRSSRSRSRESRQSAVSHEPGGRARSSSASSRSRRPRSLSSSVSSLASSVDSTPSCTPAASPTQNTQDQPTTTTNTRRYAFLIAGIFYGMTKKKAFKMKENFTKEKREKRKCERDARLCAEKQAAAERDIQEIIRVFSPKKPLPELFSEIHNTESSTGLLKDASNVDYKHDTSEVNQEKILSEDKVQNNILTKFINLNETNKEQPQTDYGNENNNEMMHDTNEANQGTMLSEDTGQNNILTKPINLNETNTEQPQTDYGNENNNETMSGGQEGHDNIDGYFIKTFPHGVPYMDSEKKGDYSFPKGKID